MSTGEQLLRTPDGAVELRAVVDALGSQFTVETAPARQVHRTRLDTFDRRLRDAGLTLEHHRAKGTGHLVLTRADGHPPLTAPVADPRWPAMAHDLPAGALREAVAPVSGIRALMVVADEQRRLRRLDLRNTDEKIVARVDVTDARDDEQSAEVAVRPLRGYRPQADRAVRLLSPLGLRPVPAPTDEEPAAHDWTAGLDRRTPGNVLLARQLREFLAAIRDNIPGTLDDIDTEFLHDLRVAVRRTRSTLKLGRPALPAEWRETWEPEFKWVGDLTTPVRDLDVYELDLPVMRGWLVSSDPQDLDPLAALIRKRRSQERRKLVRGLKGARFQRLLSEWEQSLTGLERTNGGAADVPTAGDLADHCISRAYKRVVRLGSAIDTDSPAEDLHTLRKRCKELRYALEVFAPVIDKDLRKAAVSDLKALQDVLGRFQDADVQRAALRHLAEDLVAGGSAVGTVLAMGELIGHLDADQDRARASFDQTFAEFVRPAGQRRMKRLGAGR
jgi:CHAD domain-containing protein